MRHLKGQVLWLTLIPFLFACNGNGSKSEQTNADSTTDKAAPAAMATLAEVPPYEAFGDARLALKEVTAAPTGDSVKVNFSFNVERYELKRQTADEASAQCANSKDGQHIHFILDNKPYTALYEPKHAITLAKGTEHYVLAFLSRSYHLSLKHAGASLLYHFKVNEQGKIEQLENPRTPMVFYSRPKGDYVGKDTANVLFDFYVWNTTLDHQHKVMADVNGQKMDIESWKPYFLKGLPLGKNTIRLTLVDNNGNRVTGDNTEVTREFNLAAGEPVK